MAQTPTSSSVPAYEFGDFTLDLIRGQLRRGDRELPLRPKTFELLTFLVRHGDRLLSKAELLDAVWPESHVTEDSLTQCVIEIRKALGDQDQQILKTVPRRGYLFQAKVSQPAEAPLRTPSRFPTSARRLTLGVAAVVTIWAALWLTVYFEDRRWARNAAPRVAELAQAERYFEAYDLAARIRQFVPDAPGLAGLLPTITDELSVVTDPPDASVFVRRFAADPADAFPLKRLVGRTPVERVALARGGYVLSVEKGGYATFERTISSELNRAESTFLVPAVIRVSAKLIPKAQAIAGMVFVPGGDYRLVSWGRPSRASAALDDYWIDRYEVSNRQFREFIQAGGYVKREYWKHPFINSGRALSWDEGMAGFRDRTGLSGPRSWSNQTFPEGKDNYPVSDVSWYEAAAYAEFRGKALPTVYQWEKAARDGARTHFAGLVFPWGLARADPPLTRANFRGSGTTPVDAFAFGMSPYGAYNMAGNVSEWCRNELTGGFATVGGSWKDAAYVFGYYSAFPPTFASSSLGFRCVRAAGSREGAEPVDRTTQEVAYAPVPGSTFRAYLRHYEYDKTPVKAKVEEVKETADWRRERIVFSGANDEPAIAYLYLPRNHVPPFQAIEFVPGDDVFYGRPVPVYIETLLAPYIKSGRAVLGVVLRGFLERKWPQDHVSPDERSVKYRDKVVNWATDLRRGLDYLETRKDIDAQRIAYCGVSSGSSLYGLIYTAIEPRYRSVVFLGGGLRPEMLEVIGEANPAHFAPYIRAPKLMLSGRYDEVFPLKEGIEPLYRILREPKRLVLYDGGHFATLETAVPVVNGWLDQTLGAVGR